MELQPIPPALFGDYNHDGIVDAADYTVWRNSLGTSGLAPYQGADGSGNGTVGLEDYGVWKSHFGETLAPGAGGGAAALTLTEPVFRGGEAIVAASIAATVEAEVDAIRAPGWAMLADRSARHDLAAPPRERTNCFRVVETVGDHLLLLLASDRIGHWSQQDISVIHDRGNDDHRADDLDKQDFFNDPLALALAEWS